MKYGYTIIYVRDVEETLSFFEAAFGFQRKLMTPEKDYGELVSGETTIAFASNELGKFNFRKGYKTVDPEETPVGIEMAFVTEDIESNFQKAVDAGAEIYEPIKEKPWGQKVGYLRDINGMLIEVCTPMD